MTANRQVLLAEKPKGKLALSFPPARSRHAAAEGRRSLCCG